MRLLFWLQQEDRVYLAIAHGFEKATRLRGHWDRSMLWNQPETKPVAGLGDDQGVPVSTDFFLIC